MRTNIFKSFELFLAQPISIIRNRIIRICHVEAEGVSVQNKVQFNISNESTQIDVYNNQNVYNLLTSVLHKRKMLSQQYNDNQESKIHN